VLQRLPVIDEEVSLEKPPWQKVVSPEMLGVAGEITVKFNVTIESQPKELARVSKYKPEVVLNKPPNWYELPWQID
jgi:hypothetical protein